MRLRASGRAKHKTNTRRDALAVKVRVGDSAGEARDAKIRGSDSFFCIYIHVYICKKNRNLKCNEKAKQSSIM